MNSRRRFKSLIPSREEIGHRHRRPAAPSGHRKRVYKAAGAAWLFADFLAACMSLPPDQWADLE